MRETWNQQRTSPASALLVSAHLRNSGSAHPSTNSTNCVRDLVNEEVEESGGGTREQRRRGVWEARFYYIRVRNRSLLLLQNGKFPKKVQNSCLRHPLGRIRHQPSPKTSTSRPLSASVTRFGHFRDPITIFEPWSRQRAPEAIARGGCGSSAYNVLCADAVPPRKGLSEGIVISQHSD
ncbi:hypothetical protein V22_37400 [Calycomorphotria hydatis]|uniref:Uncharacterized protein n=1 Tax=Calycomorphotria hydatis TaxID=2528027 RepID=A0A517TDN0_9PLAN|nr:hypothetical protein V22_37400 [Calycomorphotria hydatis]